MIFRYTSVLYKLCAPCTFTSVKFYRLPPNFMNFMNKTSQEYSADKNPVVEESFKVIKDKIKEYEELKSFIAVGDDKELVEIAEHDLKNISTDIDNEVEAIRNELGLEHLSTCWNDEPDLVVGEKYDNENALMEVVPGAGGQEASLFAEEIFNFYINYCQEQGCDIEVVEEAKNTLNKNSKAVTSSGITKVK